MKILLAPDSFKGTMTSKQVIKTMSESLLSYDSQIQVMGIPMSDGGEGFLDAVLEATNGIRLTSFVEDPVGRKIKSYFVIVGKKAVIEMAQASGLELLSPDEYNPLITSTYGTGQLILEALNYDIDEIIIGIGGSATNDGGMGMAMALGAKFFDSKGKMIDGTGASLKTMADFDLSGIDSRLTDLKIKVMCDVDNPLTGLRGASRVYAPQKGADERDVLILEEGMINFKYKINEKLGINLDHIEGSGAAGGLGGGLVAFLGATLHPGADMMLDLVGFADKAKHADYIITGEGKFDQQSLNGKLPMRIVEGSKLFNSKLIVVAGINNFQDTQALKSWGIDKVFQTSNSVYTLEELKTRALEDLRNCMDKVIEHIKGEVIV